VNVPEIDFAFAARVLTFKEPERNKLVCILIFMLSLFDHTKFTSPDHTPFIGAPSHLVYCR